MNYKAEIKHPWQSGPTELLIHAIEHYHKDTESDNRIAFLLFDISVETLFKTFLTLPDGVAQHQIKRNERRQAAEGNFHELLRAVQNSNPKKASEFNFTHIDHFHDLRNTLYHQGNRVTTVPKDQLKEYAELAIKLLKEYLDLEIEKANKEELAQPDHFLILARIRKNIVSLESNAAFMAEVLRPDLSSRKMEAQLRYVREYYGPDDETEPISTRAEVAQIRIKKVNEITGLKFTENYSELIEYILDYPEYLYVWLALRTIEKRDWRNDLYQHRSAIEFLRREFSKDSWAGGEFYEKLDDWAFSTAQKICDCLKANVPDVTPKDYEYSSLANQSIDWNLYLSDASNE